MDDKETLHKVFEVIDVLLDDTQDYAEEETQFDKLRALKKAWREENEDEWIDCPDCGGEGTVEYMVGLSYEGDVDTEIKQCKRCDGTGKVAEK